MNPLYLLRLADFGGDWPTHEAELNRDFVVGIACAGLMFPGKAVNCRRHEEVVGCRASYCHLVQEGRVEDDRTPDLCQCKRLRWVPWVIQNAATTPRSMCGRTLGGQR